MTELPPDTFSPPHLPLTLTPRSLYTEIPLYKGMPYVAALYGIMGAAFAAASGGEISGAIAPVLLIGTGGGLYGLHRLWQKADRRIGSVYHTIEMTEDEIIVTSRDQNGPRRTSAIKTAELATGIVRTKDGNAAYVFLENKDDSLQISTPLTPQDAREVAMMIYQAAQYASAPYHLREQVKKEAGENFRLAFPERARARSDDPSIGPGPALHA